MKDFIEYGQIIEDAMRNAVREVLVKVQNNGLQGEHHFVISFLTNDKNVKLSTILKKKFPEEMIIVIQHQFKDLKVNENNFEILLSFDGEYEKLVVSFDSISSFSDPSMNFGVKFNFNMENSNNEEVDMIDTIKSETKNVDLSQKIISLDDFRKNNDD
jgi:hypothetical protein|tara:strand:+ start:7308 stop:7781 length:474 start_codon:yes stop_codon:yes gene_type:complete